MTPSRGPSPHKGRGALSNATGRFEQVTREDFDDGWGDVGESGAEDDRAKGRGTRGHGDRAHGNRGQR